MANQIEIFVDNSSIPRGELRPVVAGEHKCEPGHSFGPYIRDYCLIHYCVSGKGKLYDKNGVHDVGKGQFFVICPGEVTTYTADKESPWHYVWIGFIGRTSERFSKISPVISYNGDTFERVAEQIRLGVSSPEIYLSHIYELMHNIFSAENRSTDVCRRVKEHIKYNYMHDLSVEKIAFDVGLNRRYLSRIFKEKYGMSIKEYIVSVRMKKACGFLESGYTVAESAFMSGYTDSFTFSKMFRISVGVAPSEWKKTNK
jgi:AraC-like DNA-binding protein